MTGSDPDVDESGSRKLDFPSTAPLPGDTPEEHHARRVFSNRLWDDDFEKIDPGCVASVGGFELEEESKAYVRDGVVEAVSGPRKCDISAGMDMLLAPVQFLFLIRQHSLTSADARRSLYFLPIHCLTHVVQGSCFDGTSLTGTSRTESEGIFSKRFCIGLYAAHFHFSVVVWGELCALKSRFSRKHAEWLATARARSAKNACDTGSATTALATGEVVGGTGPGSIDDALSMIIHMDSLRGIHNSQTIANQSRRFLLREWEICYNAGVPLGYETQECVGKRLRTLTDKELADMMPLVSPPSPKQPDGNNCGVVSLRVVNDWSIAFQSYIIVGHRKLTKEDADNKLKNMLGPRFCDVDAASLSWLRRRYRILMERLRGEPVLQVAFSTPNCSHEVPTPNDARVQRVLADVAKLSSAVRLPSAQCLRQRNRPSIAFRNPDSVVPVSLATSNTTLRSLYIPSSLAVLFEDLSRQNTALKIETLGILCGELLDEALVVTHLYLPKQRGKQDSVEVTDDGQLEYVADRDKKGLLVLGWIHVRCRTW